MKMIALIYILAVGLIEHLALAGLQHLAGEDPLGMALYLKTEQEGGDILALRLMIVFSLP